MEQNWVEFFTAAITVSDNEGKILYMNQKASKTFESSGGKSLIGKSMLTCHKAESVAKIKMLISEKKINVYTIEKKGIKKLIYQSPWFENGECKGLVELSMEIPFDMMHFVRE